VLSRSPDHGTRVTSLPGTTITRLGALPTSGRSPESGPRISWRVFCRAPARPWPRVTARASLSTLRRFDAAALGALIALFERTVGLYAELIDINAYHQPGVEAGKKAAAEVLALQMRLEALLSDGNARTLEELATSLGLASLEPLFWTLRHLCHNSRGYRAEGDWGDPANLRFQPVGG